MVYIDNHVINLNSKDATKNNGTMLSNVSFGFQGILSDDDNILRSYISVLNAQIPCSFYIINSSNNKLTLTTTSAYTVTIPPGNYNAASFISALQQTLFPIYSGAIQIIISKTNGKLTLYPTLDTTLSATSIIASVLGFSENTFCSLATGTELAYPLNLLGIKRVSIQSDALNINSYNSNGYKTSNILTTIPVDQPAFNMVSYVNQSDSNKHILRTKTINAIDIEIYDETGSFVDFNNIDWSLTLCLSVERDHSPYQHDSLHGLFRGSLKPDEGSNDDKTLTKNEQELSLLEGVSA